MKLYAFCLMSCISSTSGVTDESVMLLKKNGRVPCQLSHWCCMRHGAPGLEGQLSVEERRLPVCLLEAVHPRLCHVASFSPYGFEINIILRIYGIRSWDVRLVKFLDHTVTGGEADLHLLLFLFVFKHSLLDHGSARRGRGIR